MGRELKRVPLDFDAPLNQVWPGYLGPEQRPCPLAGAMVGECRNGMTTTRRMLEDLTQLILIAGEDSSTPTKPSHPWLRAIPNLTTTEKPGPDALELAEGLAGKPHSWIGFDGVARWTATKKIITAAGLNPETWGICPTCKGDAIHPDDTDLADDWEPTEPPEGPGYQMWETTSEGSPSTPVFKTLRSLAVYCAGNCTTFGSATATADQWEQMLDDDMVAHTVTKPDGGTMIFI